MALEDIVNVRIQASNASPTRPGFGKPLIAAQKVPATWGPNRVREFGSLTELTDAGFSVNDPAYKAAAAIKGQRTAPRKFMIGRRLNKATKAVKLTVTVATEGYVYAFKVDGKSISYTVPAAQTTTQVATALAALVAPTTNLVTATSAAAVITLVAPVGVLFEIEGWYENKLTLQDDTTDPGLTADLAAIKAETDDWYGLVLDGGAKAEILAAAAWCETAKKLFVGDVSDSAAMDPASTTDVLYALKAANYGRSGGLVSTSKFGAHASAAWIGNRFPWDPGSDTWAFKSLAGITVSRMTEGEKSAVFAKNGNTYTTIAGLPITEYGKTASGEYFDVVRGIDWLESEIKIRVFALLANAEKIPYTDAGRDMVVAVIEGALADGVKARLLAASPEPTVSAPDVADVDPTIRATRLLPDVTFKANLAGAIHAVTITGTLSV